MATIPHGKNYLDAMGEDNREKTEKIESDTVVFTSTDVYGFAPQLSYMSEQAVAADPAFWTLKSLAKPAATGKKPSAKKGKGDDDFELDDDFKDLDLFNDGADADDEEDDF